MWNWFRKRKVKFECDELKKLFSLTQELKKYNFRKNLTTYILLIGVNRRIENLNQKYNKFSKIEIPICFNKGISSEINEKLPISEKKKILKSIKKLENQILEYGS